jgi:hypothetical protein
MHGSSTPELAYDASYRRDHFIQALLLRVKSPYKRAVTFTHIQNTTLVYKALITRRITTKLLKLLQ